MVQGCADGMAQLAAAGDKEEMLQCYWDRIDFCLAKNFPTKEYLKEHFDGMLHERGIYIDERVEIAGEMPCCWGRARRSVAWRSTR